ncbi:MULTISPECIES: MetQ/NlpA family ABC transporter substrate-binding protein [unclassified Acinetobacter]|uniref:MetQ/NlpA family ABC transporter substrate-binding protein n=1 Tax=unclassified Acinetobacter TaxID=196816 RepID=UPI0029350F5D|nr:MULTISPECIES: MetQ/NlpA family ABC transporter substrate-binding protein [unclassified Acinetobacter]WOE32474.1 MetQ/NlpA family ABC transporter substrate-binding protein [Acinetobacter sp. SAAs470]WOE37950.1 MetQ/NlpA family ABC transporter substrate-binding protein [Acinetobacter sp. SAAs474]
MKRLTQYAILLSMMTASTLSFANQTVTIGASATPHAIILQYIKPELAKQGIDLKIKVYSDYVQPNTQLVAKKLDANYFQYRPFLNDFNRRTKSNLVAVTPVHIEPFLLYSAKINNIKQLKDGATVAIPSDPVNGGRALLLLAKLNLITLKPGFKQLSSPTDLLPAVRDIASNPKHLKIKELDSAMLPRTLSQVDIAALNCNYVLEANLPLNKALYIERGQDGKNIWAEYLVVRSGDQKKPEIQKVAKVLNSDSTRKFIQQRFKGEIYSAF